MTQQVKIVAILAAHPDRVEELRTLLFGMAPHCRAEAGNLRWDVWQDPTEPGRFVLDELYHEASDVTAHRATPHYQNYLARIGDLAERTAFVLEPAEVA